MESNMSQVNINTTPPPPPPPRMPSRAPIYVFIGLLAVLLLGGLGVYAARRANHQSGATATATAPAAATATALVQDAGGATATTAPVSGAATNTAAPGGGASGAGATATPAPRQTPTNPTALRVASGSCTAHRITWTWSGAQRASSYDLVLYDPVSGNTVKDTSASAPSYALGADPGATVALKVRSRNSAGTAQGYFTPGSVGRVPPHLANPTHVTATVTGHQVEWSWPAVPHATAYDLVMYHYDGGAPRTDISTRVGQAHWGTPVTPGVTYHLKVRASGQCAPSTYYNASASAIAGATPTPAAR
jgi:hypothetical protein